MLGAILGVCWGGGTGGFTELETWSDLHLQTAVEEEWVAGRQEQRDQLGGCCEGFGRDNGGSQEAESREDGETGSVQDASRGKRRQNIVLG